MRGSITAVGSRAARRRLAADVPLARAKGRRVACATRRRPAIERDPKLAIWRGLRRLRPIDPDLSRAL